jgi:hypothetical protein
MAGAALVISALTAGFTGLQWHEMREAAVVALKPNIDFDINDDPDEPPVGIQLVNAGPGPARIKSVEFFVDRKMVKDASEAGINYAGLSEAELDYKDLDQTSTVAVGERIWLIKYRKPKPNDKAANLKNQEKLADFIDQHLAIRVVFCSTVRETDCWPKCSDNDDRCR